MNQRIIDKISNLLARADAGRNDNPHEREIAMRQASSMLAKHGLAMSDVTDQAERKESLGALGQKAFDMSTRYVWERGVWACIAKLNNCRAIKSGKKLYIIGRQLNCTVTKQISRYAVESIKREARNQGYTVCSFGVGAWTGVSDQVDNILAARKKGIIDNEPTSKEAALAVIDADKQALAETNKALSEFYPRLRHSSYGYGGSSSGVSAGKSYGANMSLNNQISGASQKRIA